MMAIRQYTREELLHLRASPQISKPENLPAIEQWLEYVYVDRDSKEKLRIPHSEASQQTQNANQIKRQPQRQTPGEASPMGNFCAGSRPSLLATKSYGGSRTGGEYLSKALNVCPRDVPELTKGARRRRFVGSAEDVLCVE